MRIGIMTPNFDEDNSARDDVAGMYATLRQARHDVSLFTSRGITTTHGDTLSYSDVDWKLQSPDDLLIYHHSSPDPLAVTTLRRAHCRVVVKYHSGPPSHFMAPYSPELTAATRASRLMLDDFLGLVITLYVADSQYHAEEIERLSDRQVATHVLPSFNQAEVLKGRPDDTAVTALLARHSVNLLSIGPVVPSGGYEDMLRALARYNMTHRDRPHLHIVGSHDARLSDYTKMLSKLIDTLGLGRQVTFHRIAEASTLASFYRYSQVYWAGTRCDDFSLPMVEAMAFGMPILSARVDHLVEMRDDVAASLDISAMMAQSLGRMLDDDEQLVQLRRAGLAHFAANFTQTKLSRDFLGLISDLTAGRAWRATETMIPARLHDWFGVPDAAALVDEALSLQPSLAAAGLYSRDARLDLIRWMLQIGYLRSTTIKIGLASDAFRTFAAGIAVPAPAAHLSAAARLAWFVSPSMQEIFPLLDAKSVRDYLRWFWREGVPTMALFPILTETERSFCCDSIDIPSTDLSA